MMAISDAVERVRALVELWGGEESISGSPLYVDEVIQALKTAYEELVRELHDDRRNHGWLLPAITFVDVTSPTVIAPPGFMLPVTLLVWLDPSPNPMPPPNERQYGILQYDELTTNILQSQRTPRKATGRYRVEGRTVRTEDAAFLVGGPARGRLYYVTEPDWTNIAGLIPLSDVCCHELIIRAARLLLVRDPRRRGIESTVPPPSPLEQSLAERGEAQQL